MTIFPSNGYNNYIIITQKKHSIYDISTNGSVIKALLATITIIASLLISCAPSKNSPLTQKNPENLTPIKEGGSQVKQWYVSTIAGDGTEGYQDATGTHAQFTNPSGIAIAKDGTLYVADAYNRLIRKITPEGIVSTFVGGVQGYKDATGTHAQFEYPSGIAIAKDGTLYVTESLNHRIRKLEYK